MILNQANNLMLGNIEIQKVWFRSRLIWQRLDLSQIALIELDQNFFPTGNIVYCPDGGSASNYLRNHSHINYYVYMGDQNPNFQTIYKDRFFGLTNLIGIHLPESVTTIESYSFDSCYNLRYVDMQASVSNINPYTFSSCIRLTTVHLPHSLQSIGTLAFNQCSSLEKLNIPDSVSYIASMAFASSGLKNLDFHPQDLLLGESVFADSSLESVSLSGVSSVGSETFMNCSSLVSVDFDGNCVSNYMFQGCTSLKSVKLGKHIDRIAYRAFKDCQALESLHIPDHVITIDGQICDGCSSLTSVSIGNGLQNIAYDAFQGTDAMETITINLPENAVLGSPWRAYTADVIWTG